MAYIIGPQLNAASRIDDSRLPSKILISSDISEIESISRKLILLNEKRKLIEKSIFEKAIIQADQQYNQNSNDYVKDLSIIDILFNMNFNDLKKIIKED